MTAPTLRPYQSQWIDSLRNAFRQRFHSPLGVLPTGGGKTVCFSYLTHALIGNGKRVAILVHREELIEQVSETLTRFGVDHGRISSGQPYDIRQRAHVASVFTLARRLDRVAVPDYVICDEAHHCIAGSSWGKVIAHWRTVNPALRLIGVTATPERLSGEGLGEMFDTMTLGPTTRELIELGALSRYRLFAPAEAVDLSGLKKTAGDFARGESAARMDKPKITGDAVAHYRKFCDGAPAVAFCVSIEHAEHVAAEFRAQGYRALSIDGRMDRASRGQIIGDFRRGAINVMTSCDLISEGFDVPGIVAAILLRPTASLALNLQQVGRALRPGKPEAIILDHVGNSQTHGMPDDPREWSLLGREGARKSKAGEAACRQCGTCYAVSPAAASVCRDCGRPFPVVARKIEHVEGELSEVDVERMKREAARAQGAADSVEALIELGRLRGMKHPEGWARHVWEARERAKANRDASKHGFVQLYAAHLKSIGINAKNAERDARGFWEASVMQAYSLADLIKRGVHGCVSRELCELAWNEREAKQQRAQKERAETERFNSPEVQEKIRDALARLAL